jgi:dynein heavy chain
MLAEKQFEVKKSLLNEKRFILVGIEENLSMIRKEQDESDKEIEVIRSEIHDCKLRMKRADILLRGLSSEKQKWIVCTRMLAGKYMTVNGDVLLSASYVSLLGGFT